MDDDADNDDVMNDLMWFSYGYLCAEDDKKAKSDLRSDLFAFLVVVIFLVCGVLWAFTESIAFAVISGIIAIVVAGVICFGE